MAVSYLRPAASRPPLRPLTARRHQRGRAPYVLGGLVLVVLALVAAALGLVLSHGSIDSDSSALASISMPLGGGQVQSVYVSGGRSNQPIPVSLRGDGLWPRGTVPAGEPVSIDVVIKRPGWISWLTGKQERLHLSLITPIAKPEQQYVTLSGPTPLRVSFTQPVAAISYGTPDHLTHHVLPSPQREVTLPHSGAAGSVSVAAVPRTWETQPPSVVSWFPAGAQTAAVASPPPGSAIGPSTPIVLTFSKPVAQALGRSASPPVMPATAGSWQPLNNHAIVFRPQGYGYGLGTHVTVALPGGVTLVGGAHSGAGTVGSWNVPAGSTLRLQQVLSLLGYLPFNFRYSGSGVPLNPFAQEQAAISPPGGSFDWAYPNVPGPLHNLWAPGVSGVMTEGAVMAFENDHGLDTETGTTPAGVLWQALLQAVISGRRSTFGYTYVMVDQNSESLNLWHSGKTVLTTPVNTGVSAAPTANGIFPVFEHMPVTTMTGTNPDGSHYSDPGIQWVSYFNGGDALHAFDRASYGSPQSDGCVEMPLDAAARAYPFTPIGTLVDVY